MAARDDEKKDLNGMNQGAAKSGAPCFFFSSCPCLSRASTFFAFQEVKKNTWIPAFADMTKEKRHCEERSGETIQNWIATPLEERLAMTKEKRGPSGQARG
jgi:hypothetical protein